MHNKINKTTPKQTNKKIKSIVHDTENYKNFSTQFFQ